MVKSFSELANEIGVTSQAIHNMKNRNEDIRVHCFKQGRTWHIDETGQQMILDRSLGKPKSQIADISVYEELEKNKDKIITLLEQINELHQQINVLKALNDGVGAKLLLAEKTEEDNLKKAEEIAQLKDELSKYKKSWFGLYRKEE